MDCSIENMFHSVLQFYDCNNIVNLDEAIRTVNYAFLVFDAINFFLFFLVNRTRKFSAVKWNALDTAFCTTTS